MTNSARRSPRIGASLVLSFLLVFAGAMTTFAAGKPTACAGEAFLTGVSNVQVRTVGTQTFTSFDFTGMHSLCLADGSHVLGTIAGHLEQRVAADGDTSVRFVETLTYGDGTLDYRGEAISNGDVFRSAVRTVGLGTGSLRGIHGQGTFWFTSPTSFADSIAYVYP